MSESLTPDFAGLDQQIDFYYKKDLYARIKKLGYRYVSEFVYDRYFNHSEPVSRIRAKLPVSKTQIHTWMKKWDFKRRGRGGNVRSTFLKKPEVINQIMKCKGELSLQETADFIGCSYSTVKKIWSRVNDGNYRTKS